jgi:hypothetical protein
VGELQLRLLQQTLALIDGYARTVTREAIGSDHETWLKVKAALELAAQCAIDLALELCARRGLGVPPSYREAFTLLAGAQVLLHAARRSHADRIADRLSTQFGIAGHVSPALPPPDPQSIGRELATVEQQIDAALAARVRPRGERATVHRLVRHWLVRVRRLVGPLADSERCNLAATTLPGWDYVDALLGYRDASQPAAAKHLTRWADNLPVSARSTPSASTRPWPSHSTRSPMGTRSERGGSRS